MKVLKKLSLLLTMALVLSLSAPSTLPFAGGSYLVDAATVKISKTKATLIKGQTLNLKVTGTSSKVKWSTSKSSVATVSAKGKVTAKNKGSATLTAITGKKKLTCKITVQIPKLNQTSITLFPKKTYKLSVSGTNLAISWSTNNKNIAKVSSKGTVTAVSDGVATITATINSKKYKCKVAVSSSPTESNISYTLNDVGTGIVAIIKNNNAMAVAINPSMVFYEDSNTMLGTSSNFNFCLEPGAECALYFNGPYDTNYDYVNYSSYKMNLNLKKSPYTKYAASKIAVTSNKGASDVVASVKNKSSYNLNTVNLAIVYYDAAGKCIGYDFGYADCENAGSSDYMSFDYPHDDNYNPIIPSSYKIYVNFAYKYY